MLSRPGTLGISGGFRWNCEADRVATQLPIYRRLRRRFYHGLAILTLAAVRGLPPTAGRALCSGLARLALLLRGREREQALANLERALPGLSPGQRRRLLLRATGALGSNFYEALSLPRHRNDEFAAVRDDGKAVQLIQELQTRGRGVLVLTGHMGCWELLGAFLARRLGGLGVVTATVHNAPVDDLIQQERRRCGMVPLPRDGGAGAMLRYLRDGGVVAVLLDQNTRVPNRPIPFFGHPAPTAVGFAKLALRRRIPAVPVGIGRDGSGHAVRHLAPIEPREGADEAGLEAYLGRCNRALEILIEGNPEEWVWFHQRWS